MVAGKPVSEIDLVNLALLQLHEGGVTSILDDNSPVAVAAQRAVAPCRRALLRNHPWNFAIARASIPKVVGKTPAFDYDSFYQLPADYLRFIFLGTEDDQQNPIRYDRQEGYIAAASTANSLYLKYVKDITDVNVWDALFVEVFILELAIRLAMPLTGSKEMVQLLRERARELWLEAVAVDHQERPLDVIDVDRIQLVRGDNGETPEWTIAPGYGI